MRVFVIEAYGPIADRWLGKPAPATLYGDGPRTYSTLEAAQARCRHLNERVGIPGELGFEVVEESAEHANGLIRQVCSAVNGRCRESAPLSCEL